MASQVPEPEPDELATLRRSLREAIRWRDRLASELAKVDAEIATDAGTFRTLNGDLVRPTLDQLRRMLFEEKG